MRKISEGLWAAAENIRSAEGGVVEVVSMTELVRAEVPIEFSASTHT